MKPREKRNRENQNKNQVIIIKRKEYYPKLKTLRSREQNFRCREDEKEKKNGEAESEVHEAVWQRELELSSVE